DDALVLQRDHAGRHRDFVHDARNADPAARAALARHVERLALEHGVPDDFECEIGAAAFGHALHEADGIVHGRIAGVGGAEFGGRRTLRFVEIDRDDARRTGDARALDDRLSDAAATDHGNRRSFCDLGGIERRPDAGRHTATDEAGLIEWKVRRHLDQSGFVHDRFLGERRETADGTEKTSAVAAYEREPAHADLLAALAAERLPVRAEKTFSTNGNEVADH